MTWIVDGVSLSTLAFNVQNRSAGWRTPAKRGENLTIPGRNGTRWLPNKAFDQGSLSLSMWAIGAKEDGTLPRLYGEETYVSDGSGKGHYTFGDVKGSRFDFESIEQIRTNLDKLTALFSKTSDLLDVVRVSSSAFGLQNAATNPGFGTLAKPTVGGGLGLPYRTYQNLILNPAMRRTTTQTQITNLFPNPRLTATTTTVPEGGWTQNYENLVLDPFAKYNRDDGSSVVTSNFWASASYENYSAGDALTSGHWTTAANTSQSVVTSNAGDQTSNPQGGTKEFRVLATAALAANASLGARPPIYSNTGGGVPVLRMRIRRAMPTSTTRNVEIRIVTTDDSSVNVTTGTWQTFVLPPYANSGGPADWTTVVYDPVSSATGNPLLTLDGTNAVWTKIEFRTHEAWSTSDGFIMDCVLASGPSPGAGQGYWLTATNGHPTPGPFWHGDSAWGDGSSTQASGAYWNGTVGGSISRWGACQDTRWTATDATSASSAYYAFTDRPSTDPTGTTLGFVAMGFTTGGTQSFTTPVATPTAGAPYTLRCDARALNGAACTVELRKKGSGDSVYSTVATISFTGLASPTTTTSRMNGLLTSYAANSYIAAAGDALQVRVTVPVRTDGHHVLQLIQLAVLDGVRVFSGSTTNTVNSQYAWAGTAYNSKSVYSQRRLRHLVGRHALVSTIIPTGYSSAQKTAEAYCTADGVPTAIVLENTPLPTVNRGLFIRSEVSGALSSDALITTNPVARLDVSFLDNSGAVLSTIQSANLTTGLIVSSAGPFAPLSVRVPVESIPALATQFKVSLNLVNPLRSQGVYALNFAVYNVSVPPSQIGFSTDYFDGYSSDPGVHALDGTGSPFVDSDPITAWVSTSNDSASEAYITTPSAYTLPDGVLYPYEGAVAAKSTSTAATVTFAHPMGATTYPAGSYSLGLAARALAASTSGVTVANTPVRLTLTFLNGSTVVNTFTLGTITGNDDATRELHGMCAVTGSFTEIRVTFTPTSTTPPGSLLAKIESFFCIPMQDNCPVPRIAWNLLANPDYLDGLLFWTTTGTTPTSTYTSRGSLGYTFASSSTMLSSRFTIAAGQVLQFSFWARRGVQCAVRWYTTSTAYTSSAATLQPATIQTLTAATLTAPTGTIAAALYFTGSPGAELGYVYAGLDFATHEEPLRYDPQIYPFIDGTARRPITAISGGLDVYGQPTGWTGTADNSISQVVPQIPNGWMVNLSPDAMNVHVSDTSSAPPLDSVGRVGVLPRISKGSTATVRTVGYPKDSGDTRLSGQIAIARETGLTATVQIYGAAGSTGTGTLLFEQAASTSEIISWRDLDISGYAYFYLQVIYVESANRSGYPIRMDNLLLLPSPVWLKEDYPGYFDGETAGGSWDGDEGSSTSTYYGGGRRCKAEVVESIDMTSMAGGTRAEFAVEMILPYSFWEDMALATITVPLTHAQLLSPDVLPGYTDRSGQPLTGTSLAQLKGTTAPIDDSVFTITATGTVTGLKITDVASGATLQITGTLPTSDPLVIDNDKFTVKSGTTSLIANVVRAGSNQLLPLTPVSAQDAPVVRFEATGGTGSISVVITARRRYVIA